MERAQPELTIDPDKAFYILMKARAFDEKTEASGLEEGSNPTDDKDVAILEDNPESDATEEELRTALQSLNDDEKLDLVTLVWIGRGDFSIDEWSAARAEADSVRDKHAVRYLMETPLFSDFLEEGLALAGYDLDEFEREHF
ncbi:MAG: DUF3775 domain-containing protein [Alphaproteobacteria bacterium]|nr:DUF3775 domain-containing protein [Alphaproteobacteria bacterium]